MSSAPNKITDLFRGNFSGEPILVRAPGRINLIGEHTDYNEGFVMPGAIDKYIWFALSLSGTETYSFLSADYEELFSIQSDRLHIGTGSWPDYLLGVIDQFRKRGLKISGFNCVFGGNIPTGAGLSSSAALECGLATGLNHLLDLHIDKHELVKLCQSAENEFVGVQCGIMDQFASVFGKHEHLFKLDCRTLEHHYVPFDQKHYKIVLINTNVEHSLASSEYNKRRKECEQGVGVIQQDYPDIKSLRDVSVDILEKYKFHMDKKVYDRCLYVLNENRRLLEIEKVLQKGDIKRCGELMYETHHGLRDLYEVSCRELDFLVDYAGKSGGVVGARMMGGGFGGCTINLVKKDNKESFVGKALKAYKQEFEREATFYEVSLTGGVEVLE
ncbi:MAG: galactokinase [Bacteroidales bacterium]|nr:galactokinase [Bacteroidales bacterium]